MTDPDEELNLNLHMGGTGELVMSIAHSQAKALLARLDDEQLRLIHTFSHILGTQMYQMAELGEKLGLPGPTDDVITQAELMMGFFGAWMVQCCGVIGDHLGEDAMVNLPVATTDLLGVQWGPDTPIEFIQHASTWVEGEVPDLPPKE